MQVIRKHKFKSPLASMSASMAYLITGAKSSYWQGCCHASIAEDFNDCYCYCKESLVGRLPAAEDSKLTVLKLDSAMEDVAFDAVA